MKKLIKGVLLITLAAILLTACRPMKADAKTVKRYATQTINLKDKAGGKTLLRVKRNTKLRQTREGNTWAIIRYKGKKYVTRKKFLHKMKSPNKYKGSQLRKAGAIWWCGQKFTWYSQRVLPDPTNWLGIKGKHVDEQGFICDKWDYIALGSNTANRGKIIATPFGKFGKVYDAGYVGTYWFDCYTDW